MPDRVKLTEAQVRWLKDDRPYFNEHKDRVGKALLAKGVIKIVVPSMGGFKAEYRITESGRALLASNAKGE